MKARKLNNVFALVAVLLGSLVIFAFTNPQDQKKPGAWDIPAKYQKMENPYKGDASLDRVGKMLYAKHCKSCHGNLGLGDGPKAKQLETSCGDFSSEDFQAKSDGALYYMSIIGRNEMPNFESKIPDEEDRWAVVNFLRSLKK